MSRPASLSALLLVAGLAACGEPVDDKVVEKTAAPPPPAAAPANAPVTAQSPLAICLHNSGDKTPDIDACYAAEQKRRDEALGQYAAAASKQLKDAQESTDFFDKGQSAWTAYRTAYCDSIMEHWKGGTIRNTKYMECMIDLGAERAHQIWKDYLTFADSTPPVLPEPAAAD